MKHLVALPTPRPAIATAPDPPGPGDSPRVAAMVAYLRRHAALIDGATAGSVALAWHDTAPVTGAVTLTGPWTPPLAPDR